MVVATGSLPIVPPIPGIKNDSVYLANDILSFKYHFENNQILVLGAGLVGAETAELLAEYHNQVTIVDMLDAVAPVAPKRPRENLLNHLQQLGVKTQLESKVLEIYDDGIDYEYRGQKQSIRGFDIIVLAFGSRPHQPFTLNQHVHVIGDAAKAGDAKKAIYEATKLALNL